MTGLGVTAICAIVGACVSVLTTGVSVGVQVSQANKAEKRVKKQEKKAEMLMRKKGNMTVIKAMASAAANSTAIRIDKDIATKKLGHMVSTNGEGHYKLSKEKAKEAQENLDKFYVCHDYGKPVSGPVDPVGPVAGSSGSTPTV